MKKTKFSARSDPKKKMLLSDPPLHANSIHKLPIYTSLKKQSFSAFFRDPYIKSLLKKALIVLLITTAVFIGLYTLLRPYIEFVGTWFYDHFGIWGVFIVSFFTDFLIVPFSSDVFFALPTLWNPFVLITTLSIASILGGFAGLCFARWVLVKIPFIKRFIDPLINKYGTIIKKYNVWAVVLAALTPIPFSVISWLVGSLKMNPWLYLLAALARIPRMIIYYIFIAGGISLISKLSLIHLAFSHFFH